MSQRVKSSIPFVNLHGHVMDPGDSIGFPQECMDFAYDNGMGAIAITSHGHMNGLSYQVLHADKMKAEGKNFKSIMGVEAYIIESLDQWQQKYNLHKESLKEKNKPTTDEDEEAGIVVEDESTTKSKDKSDINKRYHIVLLAQNQKGLNNLFWLISHSYDEVNYFRYPRIDFKMLKDHSDGVIATSACLGNFLGKAWFSLIEKGEDVVYEEMKRLNQEMINIFGDRWYLELQWNAIPEQHEINTMLIRLSRETGVKLISTADFHYPRPGLWKDREMYKKLAWMNRDKDKEQEESFYQLPESMEDIKYQLYPKNGDEMWRAYKRYSAICNKSYDDKIILDSITETCNIADRIEDFRPNTEIKLPSFVVPEGYDANSYLRELVYDALQVKGYRNNTIYIERVEREIDVISSRNFSKYFLMKRLICREANKIGISGPARGSASGSLVAYLLDITMVDPIKFNLQFERFLSKNSNSLPDIDSDRSNSADLKKHLADIWGKYTAVAVTNFNMFKPRSLIKDISKFYGIPFAEVNDVTSKMLDEATPLAKQKNDIQTGAYEPTFEELLEFSPSLRSFLLKYPHVQEHVVNLSKQIRGLSQHAGGEVISDNLDINMPLIAVKKKVQTPWAEGQNVRHLESMGFVKFDELGLSTLCVIEGAIRGILKEKIGIEPTAGEVANYYEENFHPDRINFDDQDVYENIFHQGKFVGIFQASEGGMQQLLLKAKPRSLIDLSMISAIYRPGPLAAHVDEMYIKAKEDPDSVEYLHPVLKETLKDNYGLVIFQEDLSLLTHKLGKDISLDDGNEIRKLLTKRGIGSTKEKLLKYKDKFIEGCKEKKIKEKTALAIWEVLDRFSQYSFCKNHCVAYSMITYICAYLLHYHSKHWVSAFLDKEPEDKKEKAISLVQSLGYQVLPPDINKSYLSWTALDDHTLIQPLVSIKGLGEKAIEQIMQNRPFNTAEELLFNEKIVYSKLNKKSLDVLCRSGALNSLIDSRFSGDKHAWTAICCDRPKDLKKFEENIELYRPEGSFTQDEKVENIVSLTGRFPVDMVLTPKLKADLDRYKIPPISRYDSDLQVCWFIPRSAVERTTKAGKPYLILTVVDDTLSLTTIRVWSYDSKKDKIVLNRVYAGKVDYSPQWGYSMRSYPLSNKLKLLG